VFGFTVTPVDERDAEKGVSAPTAPRSGVENTPSGRTGLAVEKAASDAQNECPVAALSPFVAFSVAFVVVITFAGSVVGLLAAYTPTGTASKSPKTIASVRYAICLIINISFLLNN
jgi:choline-glycine betaine transporter